MIDLKKANFFEKYWHFNESHRTLCQEGKIVEATKEMVLDGTKMALNILYGYEGLGRPLSIAGAATVAVGGATWVQATGIGNVVAAFREETRQLSSPEAFSNAYHGTSYDIGVNPWCKLCENPNLGQKIGYGLVIAGTLVFVANKINAALDYAIEEKEKRTALDKMDAQIQVQETPTTTLNSPVLLERVAPMQNIAYVG